MHTNTGFSLGQVLRIHSSLYLPPLLPLLLGYQGSDNKFIAEAVIIPVDLNVSLGTNFRWRDVNLFHKMFKQADKCI